ncbi:MAG TPA: hypothetical protein VNW97_13100 [Candidatus Saccharimonadales bacterium]|jgi:hypothetical protein|nr:hypothetical protein [Candidatus Saccharimonadales bacterium]
MPEDKTPADGALTKAKLDPVDSAHTDAVPVPQVVTPPQTIAPIQFNQQVNLSIQQIPSSAWDRLSSDQVLEISKAIIAQTDAADKRQFDYAMEDIRRSSLGKRIAIASGSVVAIVGYAVSGYLAAHGQALVAACIAAPITTVLAVIVGNRFLDNN